MPNITLALTETNESVSRPVATSFIRQILRNTGMPNDSVEITSMGEHLAVPQSTITPSDKLLKLQADQKVVITYEEEYDEDGVNNVVTTRPEHQFIFEDKEIGVYIKPVYTQVTVQINVRIDASGYTQASQWAKIIKKQISESVLERHVNLSYHYVIPTQIMLVLKKIHELRENQAGYGESIGKWLKDKFVKRMTVIGNTEGRHKAFAIKETSVRALGWFDFAMDAPKPEKEGDGGTYRYEFVYNARYDRPDAINFVYPISVHNQPIPIEYIKTELSLDSNLGVHTRQTLSQRGQQSFEFNSQAAIPKLAGLGTPVPYYDPWLPKFTPEDYFPAIRWLLQIVPETPRELLTLTNLGDWELGDSTLNYIRSNLVKVKNPYQSPIYIQVFEDNNLLDAKNYTVDSDLNVTLNFDGDLRKSYHLVFCLLGDPTNLSETTRDEINKNCDFLIDYLTMILPDSGLAEQVTCKVDNTVDESEGSIWDKIPVNIKTRYPYPTKIMPLTQISSIIAYRNE